MREYRFYMIGISGHIVGPPTNYVLPNDSAALEEAKKLVNGHDVEIWQGPRLVAYVVPDDEK
jgi:hypothetical protein